MTIRTRIFLVYLLLVGGGFYYLVGWILEGIRPRYLESMEESLVDAANLFAATVEAHAVTQGQIDVARLRETFNSAYVRSFDAAVYSIRKRSIDLGIYVTDANGRVLYDSDQGRDEGKDYSHWLDVSRTLAGKYGARATRLDPADDSSLVIHVAAPVRENGRILGALTVRKPTKNINDLVAAARVRVLWAGLAGGGLIIVTGLAFAIWITTPIERLTAYARAVRDGRPALLPRLAGREVSDLRRAFEEMQTALEGKNYVESYTQTLAHEIKAPLSAIRGAAELLSEEMPAAQRERFLSNIRQEGTRIQQIVDNLLQLSALEVRRQLGRVEPVIVSDLAREVVDSWQVTAGRKHLNWELQLAAEVRVNGDRFLLRQALGNLVQNAVEFSPAGGTVGIAVEVVGKRCVIRVVDQGPGIPDFALPRIFERFYSLPRPDSGAKSTGLGLTFVREVAHLHGGEVAVENRPEGGCRAVLNIPLQHPGVV